MEGSDITRPLPPGSPMRRSVSFSNPFGEKSEHGVDLLELLAVLRRRKAIIGACIAVLTAVSAAIIFQITPLYTAEATVILDPRKTQVVDMQAVLSGLPYDAAVVRSEIEVLKSAPMAERVVQKLDLTSVPEFNGRLRKPTLMATLFEPMRWLVAQLRPVLGLASAPAANSGMTQEQKDLLAATGALLANTDVVNDGRSYILKVRVQSESPQLAVAAANGYIDAYLDGQLEAKFDAVRRANDWLNEHLGELRGKVEQSDNAVQLFRAQHNLIETKGATITGQQLSEINTQLILAASDRAQKESNLKQVQDLLRTGGVDAAVQVLASPLIQRLKEQEADLLREQADLATRYKPAHPAMVNIRAQISDLKAKIQDEINRVFRGMAGEVEAARAKEAALRASLQQLQQSNSIQDEAQVQLRQLEREAEANRTLYETFLNRFKQTSAQEDIQQPDARIVAAATAPSSPSYPRRGPLIGFAFAGSVLIGIFAAFGVERLDNGFRTGDQLEKFAMVTTLGLVPDIKTKELPQDTIVKRPVSSYSEAIRTIRTALRYSDIDNPPKIVLVTSSLPAEGKTVFATSLARSVARSGGKALLIDCDLRRPSIGRLFGSSSEPGILSLFEPGADTRAAIHVDEASGMHFIPATAGTSNPQDLLGSQSMRALLEEMRRHYDLIVIDAPPVLAVSDPLILSHIVDTTMFLVRWERTPRAIVLGALKSLRANGGDLAGVVLSRVNVRRHAAYGYGDSGYYYGHYGQYYGDYSKIPYSKTTI